jgi:hypothetical protein
MVGAAGGNTNRIAIAGSWPCDSSSSIAVTIS